MNPKQIEALPAIPKDLQLKVGTKTEAAWTGIKDSTEENTLQNNIQNLINQEVIILAKRMITEERNKRNRNI